MILSERSFDLKQLDPKRILIINPFGVGDVLFTIPFVKTLKANFLDSYIGYIVNRRSSTLLVDSEHIDRIFIYERDEFVAISKKSKSEYFQRTREFLKQVKEGKFDIVFDFSLNTPASLFMWLSGIRVRIGFDYKNRGWLLTHKLPFFGFEGKHVVEFYEDLLKSLGMEKIVRDMGMTLAQKDIDWADRFLSEQGHSPGDILIAVMPGAGASWGKEARFRRWPVEKFIKLVDKMIEKNKVKIILMGDKGEKDLCQALVQGISHDVIEACGKTTIGQWAALMKRCRLIVLNDGGPLHVAVAAGTRTVSIFGPVDDVVYGPFGPKSDHFITKKNLACQPCYRNFRMPQCEHLTCLHSVRVEEVLERIEEAL